MFDEEHEYLREKGIINVEQYEIESRLMREVFEQEQRVRIVMGKVRMKRKHEKHATVTRKLPRIISLQLDHRGVLAGSHLWD